MILLKLRERMYYSLDIKILWLYNFYDIIKMLWEILCMVMYLSLSWHYEIVIASHSFLLWGRVHSCADMHHSLSHFHDVMILWLYQSHTWCCYNNFMSDCVTLFHDIVVILQENVLHSSLYHYDNISILYSAR